MTRPAPPAPGRSSVRDQFLALLDERERQIAQSAVGREWHMDAVESRVDRLRKLIQLLDNRTRIAEEHAS